MRDEIEKAPENVHQLSEAKKPSKADQKRHQIFIDRMKRKVNEGLTVQQAAQAIATEDYDRLPLDQKLKRLENVVHGAVEGFRSDALRLEHNERILADSMDVNFRAFQRMLRELGVSDEDQKAAVAEAAKEIEAERAARAAAISQARTAAAAAQERKEAAEAVDSAGEPPPPPEEATDFGG
jgi:hypothetical protein